MEARTKNNNKKTMSVPEMRAILGLKKTESYWLVHRNFFRTDIVDGHMRIDIESFEKWYANQVKHKKMNGEAPGAELRKKSYSFLEAANMLGIHSCYLYDIWKKEELETITVDFTKRIPAEVFEKWYKNQSVYRKAGRVPEISELEADYLLLKDAAAFLGISKEKLSSITRKSIYKDCFDVVVYYDRKWISKRSFQHFLNVQNEYRMSKSSKKKNKEILPSGSGVQIKEYISRSEAAEIAGVNAGTGTKWMQKECFPCVGAGKVLRIHRKKFIKWIEEHREGVR